MMREKTRLELLEEIHGGQAERLREALFIISGLDDISETRRVAFAAMAGNRHGREYQKPTVAR